MDNETIIGLVTLFGAVMGTAVPYVLKCWQDPSISFDVNYGYALFFSMMVQVIGLMPDYVPIVNMKVILIAFAAGYGIQSMINKGISTYESRRS